MSVKSRAIVIIWGFLHVPCGIGDLIEILPVSLGNMLRLHSHLEVVHLLLLLIIVITLIADRIVP